MPSKIPLGAPGPWHPTVRTPVVPSEKRILRTAVPFERTPAPTMLSFSAGVGPWAFASTNETSDVTWYVPLAPVDVCHVPPPVTAPDSPLFPAGATDVPVPVSVIV